MTHWMGRVAQRAGLAGASELSFPADASIEEIWRATSEACRIDSEELAEAVARTFSLEVADLSAASPTAVKLLPESVARKYGVFPLRDEDRWLFCATSDPADAGADQEIGFASGRGARLAVAPPERIREAIGAAYAPDHVAASMLAQIDERFREVGDVDVDLHEDEAPDAVSEAEVAAGPIVKLTNLVLHEAVSRGASDIHIQPMVGHGVVRFRTDGVLHNGMQVPLPVMQRIVSRIKIMAQLDIADRLRPQDGRAKIVVEGTKYDLRVSTVPTRRRRSCACSIPPARRRSTTPASRRSRSSASAGRSPTGTASSSLRAPPARARRPRCTARCRRSRPRTSTS